MIYIGAILSVVMVLSSLWSIVGMLYLAAVGQKLGREWYYFFAETFGPASFVAVASWGAIGWMIAAH